MRSAYRDVRDKSRSANRGEFVRINTIIMIPWIFLGAVPFGCMADDLGDPVIGVASRALTPDYIGATWKPALAFQAGRQKGFQPSFIVIHVAQGYYQGTISWFQDPKSGVSSHYVVSTNGDVTQMVQEQDTAYHVGHGISSVSIGIEHEGFVAEPSKWFTDAMYTGSAKLVQDIAKRWGIPLDRCHILGHNEVPDPNKPCTYGGSEHHTDPGTGWDWAKYLSKMGGSSTACSYSCTSNVGSVVGFVRKAGLGPSNPPVASAKVSLGTKSTTTDSKGFYRFDNLPLQYFYPTTVTAPGFKAATKNQAVVIPLDHYNNFALQPGGPPPDTGTAPTDSAPSSGDTGGSVAADTGGTQPPVDGGAANPDSAGQPVDEGADGDDGCTMAPARGAIGLGPLLACLALVLVLARRRRGPV
jgi:N-acetylmuramoyl-L-alanine amidase/Carboxypeptidase regulatory-like domain